MSVTYIFLSLVSHKLVGLLVRSTVNIHFKVPTSDVMRCAINYKKSSEERKQSERDTEPLCHVRNKIIAIVTNCFCGHLINNWCLFPSSLHHSGHKLQNNTLVSVETVRHLSPYIILYVLCSFLSFCRLNSKWIGTEKATIYYLNQWRPNLIIHICMTRTRWVIWKYIVSEICSVHIIDIENDLAVLRTRKLLSSFLRGQLWFTSLWSGAYVTNAKRLSTKSF